MSEKQFCTFYLDNHLFGIEVLDVQEIIRFQEMTRVPHASQVIKGLINLRGQIVTAIDLRQRLNLAESTLNELPINIIVRTEDGSAVSFLVDDIGDVLEMSNDDYEEPPETVQVVAKDLIKGIYKLKDRFLVILDTRKLLYIES
ncbi:MAG: purine-binding chemotaxis protein CheW [Leptospiraceae bacterium]|nr:purine-binding chemotaxis protein CheW [Leptospiraceae bacterium]